MAELLSLKADNIDVLRNWVNNLLNCGHDHRFGVQIDTLSIHTTMLGIECAVPR